MKRDLKECVAGCGHGSPRAWSRASLSGDASDRCGSSTLFPNSDYYARVITHAHGRVITHANESVVGVLEGVFGRPCVKDRY